MLSQHGLERMKDLLTAVEQCAFLEEFAGDHMFEGIKSDLFPHTL